MAAWNSASRREAPHVHRHEAVAGVVALPLGHVAPVEEVPVDGPGQDAGEDVDEHAEAVALVALAVPGELGRAHVGAAEQVANSLVGHLRGGLAYVVVLTSMLFAGVTGVALAECAAIGA